MNQPDRQLTLAYQEAQKAVYKLNAILHRYEDILQIRPKELGASKTLATAHMIIRIQEMSHGEGTQNEGVEGSSNMLDLRTQLHDQNSDREKAARACSTD